MAHYEPTTLVYNISSSDMKTFIVENEVILGDRLILTVDKTEVIGKVKAIVERLKQPYL
ncbi:hypothetical protein [Chlorogloeopsis sp. ULAP02]|uniref:hypothetical protein n=1 Tax=Chlorogloeopsis sp. ULAP02 TaxID=3107926 RepID=UPI003136E499